MSLVPAGGLVLDAAARGRAVAAFNIITLEHAEAVVAGAEAAGLPVLLQLSENAVKFRGGALLPISRAAVAVAEAAGVPVGLHLDHVKSSELLRQAVDAGFSSVMYDAAHLSYAENLEATRSAADWAHVNGLWIEAELGEVGGKNGAAPLDPHAPGARTDPDEARRFVADSGVDALAVAIGSSHAMTSRTAALDHVLLGRLAKTVDVPLVLHGSSGLPDAELAAAVAGGIRKVNIGTALNVAMTEAIRTHLTPADPRPYLTAAREAMTATAAAMISALN
ncbi:MULTISPECIES: class II fructose-bisphosphate aldolase [unclassified Streptomyces]|uniref:class II fructose-bisphosphate aldolase n=1 Tax=unclassified Streptomyces TaxID=2593676 RepID=UPI00202EB338|nr:MULTISPECIES: class II fructose-bisphosphate aldolase [unclassified Streptomyces]MCM1965876.1 ketose-bisphosphate aldolase [Streptomyces sp. G1]MCX5126560.1 ketose-bisphosphate aldolase [Streptomyces sp. NBC_00347]